MKNKPIIIVAGQPDSIFFEIFFKIINSNFFLSPLILIGSEKILLNQIKKFKVRKKIRLLNFNHLGQTKLDNKTINLMNINHNLSKKMDIKYSKKYIKDCFNLAFKILESGFTFKFINGPINKSKFLDKKFLGITEYVSNKFKIRKFAMLIYNDKLSVCPLTTHLPLKSVSQRINNKMIKEKVLLINNFYKKTLGFKPKIGVTGLNPHCESINRINEDKQIITPSIRKLKKTGFKIFGPYPADTIFLKKNREKFDVILGMYHDQVLTPIKTLFEYDAINITIGLPFIRVSPDHGVAENITGKNIANPKSLIESIKFFNLVD